MPAFLRDFVEHLIGGYRARFLPIANGVRLTLSSGVLLIVTLIVGYRFIDWAAAWLWFAASRLIGPHDLDSWQLLSQGVTLLFGSPFQDSSTGILIEPVRICFLAAHPGNRLRAAEAGAGSDATGGVISSPAVRSADNRAARC